MLAVFKREFRSFFQNVIGWVFIATMVFVAALYFYAYNISYGLSDIVSLLYRLLTIMIFSIPVLVMRILTEERKQKIDQLTLTAPVKVGSIIWGKYLAMCAIYTVTVLVISSFILLISSYITIDWGINLLAVFGFLLYGFACIAVCMFITSFTESQVIAAIVSIIVMFTIYMMSGVVELFDASQNEVLKTIAKGINLFNFYERFETFFYGILDAKAIIYFISFIVVFVFLTIQSVQKRRYTTSVKNLSVGAYSIVSIIAVIAIFVGLNIGVKYIPESYTQTDLTLNKLYSISDVTKDVVADITSPVTIYVYGSEETKNDMLDKVLGKYSRLSSYINVEYANPADNSAFYSNYTDTEPSVNSVIIESAERTKVIDYNDMFIVDYDYETNETTTSYDIEGQITAGLNYINNGVSDKVYVTTGHNEVDLDVACTDAIEKQNYSYESLNLTENDIPKDCKLLLINAPSEDFTDEEADKIYQFADKGGDVFIVLDILDDIDVSMPNFNSLLEYYNVTSLNGLMVDLKSFNGSPFFIIPNVGDNPATTGVYNKKPVWLPYAKALGIYDENVTDCVVSPWLTSTNSSYLKANATEYDDYMFNPETDKGGPFDVAVTSTKTIAEGIDTNCYVVGSIYMFTQEANQPTGNANITIFSNIINQGIGNDESSVVIPVKTTGTERFIITNSTGIIIFIFLLVVIPVVLLIAGFVIWSKRRKY